MQGGHVVAGVPVPCCRAFVGGTVEDGYVGVLSTDVEQLEVDGSGITQDAGRVEVVRLVREGRGNWLHPNGERLLLTETKEVARLDGDGVYADSCSGSGDLARAFVQHEARGQAGCLVVVRIVGGLDLVRGLGRYGAVAVAVVVDAGDSLGRKGDVVDPEVVDLALEGPAYVVPVTEHSNPQLGI